MILRDRQTEALYGGSHGIGVYNAFEESQSCLLVMATGMGKCLAPGTPVLMFNGEIKPVEQVRCGDQLMGPDSLPRMVVSLAHGCEEMFRVTPTKGDHYVVNKSHILSLKFTNENRQRSGSVVNVSVADYLLRGKTFKHCAKGWRVGVDFPTAKLPVDPYFLGLWLGDGNSRLPTITTGDDEIKFFLSNFAKSLGLSIRIEANSVGSENLHLVAHTHNERGHTTNFLKANLRALGVLSNKHIPLLYRASSRGQRLALLAGLIDSDGYLTSKCYEISSKSKAIADGILFIARSLGFAAYARKTSKRCANNGVWGEYYRINISGSLNEIPCKIARKKSPPRLQKKNVLLTGISIESIGDGEFYGFELDGDGLFMLGDFTVTHNTILGAAMARDRIYKGRFLFLVDQIELAIQTRDKFLAWDIDADIEMGDSHSDSLMQRDVVIMSVQTARSGRFGKRMHKFNPGDFSTLFVDEAHLSVSKQFRDVISYFGSNPYCNIVGVTATPDRSDGKSLGMNYETVAFNYSMLDGIKDGYLVEPRQEYGPLIGVDYSELKSNRSGDFKDRDIASAIDSSDGVLMKMASGIIERLGDQRTIVFTASVEHAKKVSDYLNAHKRGSANWVCGETDAIERRQIFESFGPNGDVQYLCNYGITTKGYDNYTVKAAAMLRLTKSRSLYEQMIGRLTRSWEGAIDGLTIAEDRLSAIANSEKPFATVLDFPGNSGNHKIVGIADVLAGSMDEEIVELAKSNAKKEAGPLRMREELERAEQEIKLARKAESEARQKLKVRAEYEWTPVSLFEGERSPTRSYSNEGQFTDKQKGIFKSHGIDYNSKPYGYLKSLIPSLLNKPSKKQEWILTHKIGVSSEALQGMSKSEWKQRLDNYFEKA